MTHPLFSSAPEELELHITTSHARLQQRSYVGRVCSLQQRSARTVRQRHKESGYNESHRDYSAVFFIWAYKSQAVTNTHVRLYVFACQLTPKHIHLACLGRQNLDASALLCAGQYPDICLSPKSLLASIQTKLHNKSLQMFKQRLECNLQPLAKCNLCSFGCQITFTQN